VGIARVDAPKPCRNRVAIITGRRAYMIVMKMVVGPAISKYLSGQAQRVHYIYAFIEWEAAHHI